MAFSPPWNDLLGTVADTVAHGGAHFFRGQEWQGWGLVPALGRLKCASVDELHAREERLFTDFRIRAGSLLDDEDDAWRIAFLMQHHGLPTRLLDWSASFAIALWRAREDEGDAVVWVLDAASLNRAVGAARNCCSTARSRGTTRNTSSRERRRFRSRWSDSRRRAARRGFSNSAGSSRCIAIWIGRSRKRIHRC